MSETNAAVALGEEVGGPVNLLEQHGSLIDIATDPSIAEMTPTSKTDTHVKPEENDGSSHAGLADETTPATEKVIAQLAEAAATVSSEDEAVAVMGALSHTLGVNKSKITPDVLSRLLPDDEAVVLPQVSHVSGGIGYRAIKRAFEVISCAFALVIFALPMGVVALKLRMESPGPAVFSQTRVGKNGREFKLYKFRSMYVDAEVWGAQWATEEDPRVDSRIIETTARRSQFALAFASVFPPKNTDVSASFPQVSTLICAPAEIAGNISAYLASKTALLGKKVANFDFALFRPTTDSCPAFVGGGGVIFAPLLVSGVN